MSKKQLLLPHCIGDYEPGDDTCGGDPSANTSEERAPCGWRDRCSGLACYMQETSKPIVDFVKFVINDDDNEHATPIGHRSKFEALCDEQIQRYGIKEGTATKDPIGDPPKPEPKVDGRKSLRPTKRAQRAARRALMKRAKDRRAMVWKLVRRFQKQLGRELELAKTPYRFSTGRHAIAHGRMYIVDRANTSSYVSIYVRNMHNGRDVPVVSLKFKTRDLTVDVSLPVESGKLSQSAQKKLKPLSIDDGLFRSVFKGLDKAGMSLMAETIAGLVKSGSLKLPRPRLRG